MEVAPSGVRVAWCLISNGMNAIRAVIPAFAAMIAVRSSYFYGGVRSFPRYLRIKTVACGLSL
jgi:hypothetical protein